jgi:glycosyltransferase involved in cell wall biosynthesis
MTQDADITTTLHLLHVFPSFEVGGQQIRFVKIANRLGRRYRHSIVALDGNQDCRQLLDPALDVTMLTVPARKGRGLSLRNLWAFRHRINDLQPDLLLTYNWAAVEWALANRWRPVCRNLHFEDGFGPEEVDGQQIPRRVWFRRVALTGATEVIVPSRGLERIATEIWRIDPRRVKFIANGVDGSRFARGGGQVPAGLRLLEDQSRGPVVGSVGTLRTEKNFGRLIRAVAALPAEMCVRLVLVGDGPEREALERLSREVGLGNQVVFTGAVMRPEALLQRFDLFALSSDTEQMPLSLLEAMAAGLPVVATDVGDVNILVSAQNRPFVVSKEDEKAFVASLMELLRDGELRRRLGEHNQARALEQFDEATMVAKYDRLFTTRAKRREGELGR